MGYTLEQHILDGWLETIDKTGRFPKKDYDMFIEHVYDLYDVYKKVGRLIEPREWRCDCDKVYVCHTREQLAACAKNGDLCTMPDHLIPEEKWLERHHPEVTRADDADELHRRGIELYSKLGIDLPEGLELEPVEE